MAPDLRSKHKALPAKQREELLRTLKERFDAHPERHPDVAWTDVLARLDAHADKAGVLAEMERTGGEPDVVGRDKGKGELIFMDCAPESPTGRRSVCYDREGWLSRKEARPENTAVDMAAEIGIELLTEEQYLYLQKLGAFDTKTSSWVAAPPEIRKLGGALYGERRYGRVFIGHNGAQSYYAVRGFRGSLRV